MSLNLDLVKSIIIPEGEVKSLAINDVIVWEIADIIIAPLTERGEMPCAKINVSAGDVVVITYFITENKGYIYDGRQCGLQYYGSVEGSSYPISDDDLNKECTITLNIPQDGFLAIGANSTILNRGDDTPGSLSQYDGDIPVGKYIKFKIN